MLNQIRKIKILPLFGKDILVQQLKQKLQEANHKLEMLSLASNEAIRDCDIRTNTVTWNHGLITLFGYNPETIEHRYEFWVENIHPADRDDVLAEISNTFGNRRLNWSAMYRFKCASGSYKHVYDRACIVYDETQPIRMIGTMQDIDERMNALAEIERLSLVASKTDNLVVITDAEEKIEWVNDAFIKRTGYTVSEVIGKTTRILQGSETETDTLNRISMRIRKHESISEEVLNYTKDGKKFWVRININPVLDDAQNLIRCVIVQTDITIHKEYERKITAIARAFSDLIENANAIIFGVDRNGYVSEWNHYATSITGYVKNELLGRKLVDIIIPQDRKETVKELIQYILAGNNIHREEFQIINRNGEENILLLSATPRRNATGEIIGFIAVGQDITELTQYRTSLEEKVRLRTKELDVALEKEKELSTLKTRFASMVSHEFRTPLATIRLSANHIKRYKDRLSSATISNKINTVIAQVDHMSHLLEDVLIFGKTQDVKLQITKSIVDITLFCKSIKEQIEGIFKKSHRIECSFAFTENEIETDEGLLRNIVVNLLSNAIKFSPGKTVVYVNGYEHLNNIVFEIKDEGIGIPSHDIERIFEPFDRGTNASTIPGTGLGLSIVKKAVDLLGGIITVKSEQGKGTVFSFSMPKR